MRKSPSPFSAHFLDFPESNFFYMNRSVLILKNPPNAIALCMQINLRWSRGDPHLSHLRVLLQYYSKPRGVLHPPPQNIELLFSGISCGKPEVEQGATLLSHTFMFGSRVPYACPSGKVFFFRCDSFVS